MCEKILAQKPLNQLLQKCLGRGFFILQNICELGHKPNALCINLCVDYLSKVVNPNESDPILDIKVTMCALHFLWDAVLSNEKLSDEFVKRKGIYLLLDIIYVNISARNGHTDSYTRFIELYT